MSYKSDSNKDRFDLDWVEFPDDDLKVIVPDDDIELDNKDISWSDGSDQRPDDLLLVNRLEFIISGHHKDAQKQLNRKELKPAPMWMRVLFHVPKNNAQTLLFNALYIGLMGIAIALFIYAYKTIF